MVRFTTRGIQVQGQKSDKVHMNSPNWATAFGLTETDLADLENHLAGSDHPLRWLLMNGHIEGSAYMHWARDEYGLPSVKESYFDIPVDLVFWEAVKHEFKWTPHFFPLTEWEGVMLIGCLQPPDFHFPLHTPHRFVIASANALERRFRELEPALSSTAAPLAAHAAPVIEEQIHADQVEDIPPSHAQSEPDLDRSVANWTADSLPAAPDVDMRDPDGLVVPVDSNSNIDLFAIPDGMQATDLGAPIPTAPDGFEGSSHVDDTSDFSEAPTTIETSGPEALEETEVSHAPPAFAPAVAVAPPRAPIVPPGPPAAAVKAAAEKVVMPPAPPPPPTPTESLAQPAFRSNVSSAEPAVPLATCTSIDSLMAAAVAHTCVHFEHAMVLNYENSVLKPSKWSELLLSIKGDNADAISLEAPSIFRIAARTSLPYHGYVVANPVNTAFFNSFNRGMLPKHVTIMPVMIAGQLTAMLVGLSNQAIDYKGTLVAMEKLASDFSTQLERLREKERAAA